MTQPNIRGLVPTMQVQCRRCQANQVEERFARQSAPADSSLVALSSEGFGLNPYVVCSVQRMKRQAKNPKLVGARLMLSPITPNSFKRMVVSGWARRLVLRLQGSWVWK